MRAFGPDGAAGLPAFVRAEIVEHDDVAWPERRREDLLDISGKESAVDRAVDHPWRVDPVVAERADEGQRLPTPEWSAGFEPLSFGAPAPERSHVGFHPCLVNEDKAFRVDAALTRLPARPFAGDVGAILLSRQDGFF